MNPIRTLDLSTFTGDTWAVQATAAVPTAAAVSRLIVQSDHVAISLRPRAGIKAGSASVADDVTVTDLRVVKIVKDERGVEFPSFCASLVEATTETSKLGRTFIEEDVSIGDIIVIGLPSLTTGEGSADGLSIYVTGADPEVASA